MSDTLKNTEDRSAKGNTLDYYNDDMSRKAVGRLFDNLELDDNDNSDDDMLKNYDQEPKEEIPPTKVLHRSTTYPRDSYEDYDISIYQYKKNNNIKEMEALLNNTKTKKTSSPKYQEPRTPSPKVAPVNARNTNNKSSKILEDEYDEYDEYDEASFSFPPAKIIVTASFFVFTLILAMLILKINSLNKNIKENETAIAEVARLQVDNSTLQLKNKELESEIEALTNQIDGSNTAQPSDSDDSDTSMPSGSSSDSSNSTADSSNTNTNSSGSTASTRSHTVVSGDNLSKISQKYYGTPNEYQKIMDANSITGSNLKVGQVLIIP